MFHHLGCAVSFRSGGWPSAYVAQPSTFVPGCDDAGGGDDVRVGKLDDTLGGGVISVHCGDDVRGFGRAVSAHEEAAVGIGFPVLRGPLGLAPVALAHPRDVRYDVFERAAVGVGHFDLDLAAAFEHEMLYGACVFLQHHRRLLVPVVYPEVLARVDADFVGAFFENIVDVIETIGVGDGFKAAPQGDLDLCVRDRSLRRLSRR